MGLVFDGASYCAARGDLLLSPPPTLMLTSLHRIPQRRLFTALGLLAAPCAWPDVPPELYHIINATGTATFDSILFEVQFRPRADSE